MRPGPVYPPWYRTFRVFSAGVACGMLLMLIAGGKSPPTVNGIAYFYLMWWMIPGAWAVLMGASEAIFAVRRYRRLLRTQDEQARRFVNAKE